ncbi:MAG: nitroreductase family protein, partial [Methanophagales archaeon]|nr:nitroreductase family protein [Methanophagales archaeon]
ASRFMHCAHDTFIYFHRICAGRDSEPELEEVAVDLNAGHIAQNVALAAVALNLDSCQVGALYDDEVNALLDVDGTEESVVYMTVVGKRQ